MIRLKQEHLIPYARHLLDEDDIAAVCTVLSSDWLTTGPMIDSFEKAVYQFVDAKEAVAVSSGTAALHAAIHALGIGPGDEVIVPAMTFAATANCVVFQGATPVFADIDPDTLLINPEDVRSKITPRTRAVIAVDYAGQPCDYGKLREVCDQYSLALVADACHSLGASYKGQKVGTLADLTAFSFHPAKHITTGEGGMVVTDDPQFAQKMRVFRNHGITADHNQRVAQGTWFYEMVDLGYNYRITDIQCALGISQLKKLPAWVERRREIAGIFNEVFSKELAVEPLGVSKDVFHSYHLYTIKLDMIRLRVDRAQIFTDLRKEGIGVNVHYIPVHLHPFYRNRFNTGPGMCEAAEAAYERIISLPMFPTMNGEDVADVIAAVSKVCDRYYG